MSIIKMRGPIDVLFAFKIFSLPVPVRELFGKYPTRPVPKSKTPTRQTLVAIPFFDCHDAPSRLIVFLFT